MLNSSRADLRDTNQAGVVSVQNMRTHFCQQQGKLTGHAACLGKAPASSLVRNRFKNNICVQQGAANLHFKMLRKPVGQPGVF